MSPAEKLLERMRQTKAGWGYADLDSLYRGFGFEVREKGKHAMYIHPNFPELRATVARHGSLPIGYISHGVKLMDKLKRLEASKAEKQGGGPKG